MREDRVNGCRLPISSQLRREKCRGMFVVDLDGTLLTSKRQFAREDLDALTRLHTLGYVVVIATGRSDYSFNQLLQSLGMAGWPHGPAIDYVIFSTGAGIMDFPAQRLLQNFILDLETVRQISSHLESSGIDFMIHKPIPDTRFLLYSGDGRDNPDFLRRLNMYRSFASPLSPAALQAFAGATQILCILGNGEQVGQAGLIADSCRQCSIIRATSPLDGVSLWLELFAYGVSKSSAVKWLAETIGIPQDRVCAVGNDYNDVDLLQWAGQSFLVANGPRVLKKLFPQVASNDKGGVSEAITRWLADDN